MFTYLFSPAKLLLVFFLLISASISSITKSLQACLEYGIPLVWQMEKTLSDQEFVNFDHQGSNNPGIVHFESSLLDAAASKSILGVFYILPLIFEDKIFLRYIESGCYEGFLNKALSLVKTHCHIPEVNYLPWRIYTQKDVELQSAAKSSISTPLSKQYNRKIHQIMVQLDQMKTKLDNTRAIVFLHKANADRNKPNHRYITSFS